MVEEFVERRVSDRIHVMESVEIDLGGARLEATALDLSVTGVSVWAPQGITPVGDFTITMRLDQRGPMKVAARLAREFESDGGAVWGIAFVDPPPEVCARIEAYLEQNS
jgi:hypothetical protein